MIKVTYDPDEQVMRIDGPPAEIILYRCVLFDDLHDLREGLSLGKECHEAEDEMYFEVKYPESKFFKTLDDLKSIGVEIDGRNDSLEMGMLHSTAPAA